MTIQKLKAEGHKVVILCEVLGVSRSGYYQWLKCKPSASERRLKELMELIQEARAIYKERGFMREMGQGKASAITTVDMAKAWMSEGHPFTCDKSEEVCAEALKVLEAGRKKGIPIFHTTTGYTGDKQWTLHVGMKKYQCLN